MSSKKVRYRGRDGERLLSLQAALEVDDAYYAVTDLLVLLVEKGVIALEEAAKVINDDDILGWAEDDNGEG
jgi:hypothetical protein